MHIVRLKIIKDIERRTRSYVHFGYLLKSFVPPNYGFPQKPEIVASWLQEKLIEGIPRSKPEIAVLQMLAKHKNILIDTEAYSAFRLAKLNRHISELQDMWRDIWRITGISLNWVIFIQKELYDRHEHFFIKKFKMINMERIQPKNFVEYINSTFENHPFSDEALFELAALSRGIWRRFKWYINDCFIEAEMENKQKISLEDVKRWIGIDRAIEDIKIELDPIFREGGFRREAAAKILLFLSKEEKFQSDIQKHIEVSAKECSIILKKLKKEKYIISKRKGLYKIWRINVEGGD